ncbi:MAG: TVP38/TMEM64 family protein [Rhodospirillales bacterium]|nr:TVP38/TMEM64 family protein [Rhodospirillales bacterium]
MNDENQEINARQSGLPIKRLAPIVLLVIGLGAAFLFDLHHFLSFEMLKENRESLLSWAQNNHILSAVVFIAAYAAAIAISLPGAIWFTILGGFMFGTLEGGILVVFAATLGATVIFLAARYAFADFFRKKAGPAIRRMEDGFRANAVSYMLVLRLVPLFPFWLVNLVPAFLGVSTRTYVTSTLVGIMPGTFVYASLGNGIGHLIDAGQAPDLSIIFAPEVLGPLIGLAALSLVPVVYKRFKARGQAAG